MRGWGWGGQSEEQKRPLGGMPPQPASLERMFIHQPSRNAPGSRNRLLNSEIFLPSVRGKDESYVPDNYEFGSSPNVRSKSLIIKFIHPLIIISELCKCSLDEAVTFLCGHCFSPRRPRLSRTTLKIDRCGDKKSKQ